ncbi:MAG: phosphohydrolase, partial [Desulfatibacillaceae bacterium]|nr:phosphohydrolase [Desulfatibacillaceae bacterium]
KKQGLDEKRCLFVYEAAWLHDVGIGKTWLPQIGCMGKEPYIRHGVIGHEMLADLGLVEHALVCERHVGVGISCKDIAEGRLPLPMRDMTPQTLEERIVAYADKFYSKTSNSNGIAKAPEQAAAELARISPQSAATFLKWHQEFCAPPN